LSRILEVGDKSADLPVAWARSREEAIESELDLLAGHPGRIDPVCVGHDAPYGVGDLVIRWYMRPREGWPVFMIEDRDIELISKTDYAERVARMDRGERPT
jgi:hypothetical protein